MSPVYIPTHYKVIRKPVAEAEMVLDTFGKSGWKVISASLDKGDQLVVIMENEHPEQPQR